jgi:predicted nucleic acid-binding protein
MGLNISVDTNLFIEVKNKETHYQSSKQILDMIDSGELTCVLSTVVIAEMCVGYHLMGELKEKDDFIAHVTASQNYSVIDLSARLADQAARVKSATSLKLPDAIIVATAVGQRAECLISDDDSLKKAEDFVSVMTASEFMKRYPRITRK